MGLVILLVLVAVLVIWAASEQTTQDGDGQRHLPQRHRQDQGLAQDEALGAFVGMAEGGAFDPLLEPEQDEAGLDEALPDVMCEDYAEDFGAEETAMCDDIDMDIDLF